MPIEALPQKTIRAIGSTSVISDPYSVVKELVDNALDASATSLQIEISQNTVDVIQLKDNGHGISPEDQQHVCKRAFTSKIQTLDDLKNVGGSSLGFRGEALASVAEMSGVLAVTTRVASEVAGLCLKYGKNGELTGSQPTSHPVGTTVRITDFLKHIPVRRQTALKGAARNLTRIKKLLQAYAIAQPSKRLSLKVLKAKNENSNWTYAPSADASLSDAALKVTGTEVSSCCVLRRLSSHSTTGDERGSSDQKDYEAIAFLPKTQFDTSKINSAGQYISVDGRPLSSSRGIGHELVRIFKPYVRGAASKNEFSKSVIDPFLCLHIRCPRGTYDVNIEPAKDDLLFEDPDVVLGLVENLFRNHYGKIEGAETKASTEGKEGVCNRNESSEGFGLLMARKPATEPADPDDPFSEPIPFTSLSPKPVSYQCVFSPVIPSSSKGPESPNETLTSTKKHSRFVNPWSISRINASFQTPRGGRDPLDQTSPVLLSSSSLKGPTRRESVSQNIQHLPNSDMTSPFTSPVRRRRQDPQASTESSAETNRISSARHAERERDRNRYGNGALDTWFQRTTQVSLEQNLVEEGPTQEPDSPLSFLAQERFGLPRDTSPNIVQVDGQSDGCSDSPSKTTITPEDTHHRHGDHIPESIDSGRGRPVLERWAAQLHRGVSHDELSDLEKALDFERRKKEAIQNSRTRFGRGDKPSTSQSAPVSHSPHRSRYLAAKSALTSSQTSVGEPVSTTTLSPHDPRAYLIRKEMDHSTDESSKKDSKVRKRPTNRLPLERIPDGCDLHDLGLTCSVDLSSDSNSFRRSMPEDLYTDEDNNATAFSAADLATCSPFWNDRLMLIMKQRYKNKDGSPFGIEIDLATVISRHLRNIANHENN
ncbi:Ribosomal protein S5 domain 2-type fold, subgroup [Penicillium griseofulvum]|uniref:Ribosomal protein S5 domain 2-type fold, subgroup n=1 Tax=Penicillium patulum TaxID=5078 RepID=A0A135LT13_PENPA|nr:Ribosomal protein S5 domain 2-type fold, subgroup [Penicillium griseofulvum]KXG52102.1 Ribosomal protein S5 domain 2-type fold, subgroup [Penicillium griseofulvum]